MNNKQIIINKGLQKAMKTIDTDRLELEHNIIEESYQELNNVLTSINMAKGNIFLSNTINIKDIKEIINKEKLNIPVINILEYSKVFTILTEDSLRNVNLKK